MRLIGGRSGSEGIRVHGAVGRVSRSLTEFRGYCGPQFGGGATLALPFLVDGRVEPTPDGSFPTRHIESP